MKVVADSKVASVITWIAGVVAVIVSCAPPMIFFVSSYKLQQALIDTETEINARIASQVINANPTFWRFQQPKLEELLKRRPNQGDLEVRRIVDLEGVVIAESVEAIAEPSMWRSRDILDAGVKVGEIRIGRSLRPLLYQTAGVGLVAVMLGLCVFVAMRVLPLRALNRALAENTKLVQETKRAEEVQKFLKELSQDIASLNIDSLLRKLTEKVREFFKADVADVRIVDGGVWKVKGVSGTEPERTQSDSTGTARGRSRWILENRQPLLVPDILKQTGFSGGESIRKAGIRGYVGIPLFSSGGEVIGILRVLSYLPREFSVSEVDLLQQLANGAAIALTNARLYDETERRRREAEALARVVRSLTATLDMGAVGERIVTSVRELFGVKASTLRLLQPDGSLRALASAGEAFSTRSGEDVLVAGTGLASVAVAEGRPIWSADVLNEPRIRLTDQMRDYQLRSGDRSMIAVPLRAHEKIIGSLGLADRTGRTYSDSDVALVQTFADQAALALENARLYEEMVKLAADLSRSNKVKDEFLSVMSHELRTPLNVVMGYVGMIKDGMLGEINPEQEKALEKVLTQSRDQLGMINGILQATQMEAEGVRVERREVRLEDFLDDLRSGYEIPLGKELSVIWDYPPELPVVHTDAEKLKQVLQNLINNAIKFTEKGNVTVSARYLNGSRVGESSWRQEKGDSQNGVVELKVSDTGVGIAKEHFSVIFERFRQVDSSETRRYGGVGIGLYVVKKFTELLGGKVEVQSEAAKGSTFTVTIPCESYRSAASQQRLRAEGRESNA